MKVCYKQVRKWYIKCKTIGADQCWDLSRRWEVIGLYTDGVKLWLAVAIVTHR
jgi:hypothetical protein